MPQKYKRRQILIDAELQIGLSMNILGWLYFYVVLFALLANAPSVWAVFTAGATDPSYFEAVQRLQWFAQFTVMPLAATFIAVGIHGVIFTHRVAGPIYRLKQTLRDMAQRKLPDGPVRLREKDYFKDVAQDLTTVIESMKEDGARRRRMNDETVAAARELLHALETGNETNVDVRAMAHRVLDNAERMDRHLAASLPADAAPQSAAPAVEVVTPITQDAGELTADFVDPTIAPETK
jgi:hypothetical protein